MTLIHRLREASDEEQLRLHPLPTHAAAGADEHLRRHYALLLAAGLSTQPKVGEASSRLFLLLLQSLGLGDARAALFEEARALDAARLTEALRLVREAGYAENLLPLGLGDALAALFEEARALDAARLTEALRLVREAGYAENLLLDLMVLLRLEAPLEDTAVTLLGELADFLGVSNAQLHRRADEAAEILGITDKDEIPLAVIWPAATKKFEDYAAALKKAAESGDAKAQNYLGWMYQEGHGVRFNVAEAVKWYRKAAEQGNAYAQINLGEMYSKGRGVPQDYAEAAKWYRKAAEQGNAQGQSHLGFMYKEGYGVPQDYAEAAKWYRKAAEQGHAWGQFQLGLMYKYGSGVPQDYAEAAKWYRKAAEQGNEYAQHNLGLMYEEGQGVPQDWVLALALISPLSWKGDPYPYSNLRRLAEKMSLEDINAAGKLAQELSKPGNFARALDAYLSQAHRK